VVDNDEVVGIITHNDIFDAFVDLLGYYEAGTRYVIEVTEDKPGILAEVAQCFFDQKAIITNLAVYHYPGIVDIVIRARDAESNAMKQVLTTRGFNVVSVIENK
jgi:acetoin utilization protein AcuB